MALMTEIALFIQISAQSPNQITYFGFMNEEIIWKKYVSKAPLVDTMWYNKGQLLLNWSKTEEIWYKKITKG